MSDASLRARMLEHAGAAPPELESRVRGVDVEEIETNLSAVGLDAEAIEELARDWVDFRRSPEWVTLLAAFVAMIERERGDLDAPIPIWPDLLESGVHGHHFYLYLVALTYPGTTARLREQGADDRLLAHSWNVVVEHRATFAAKWACVGVDAGWWMFPLLRTELVRVASLEFHLVRLDVGSLAPEPWYDHRDADRLGDGFRRGDPSLGLHIPQGTDLSPDALDATFDEARRVLGVLWPTTQRRLATCQSWMLDDRLLEMLPESSNLVRFLRRFTLLPTWRDGDEDVAEFVFRSPGTPLEQLDQSTSLRRGVVRTLRSGEHWRARTGWFDFDGIES